jgi:hypothetical protein
LERNGGAGGRGQGPERVARFKLVAKRGIASRVEADCEALGNTPCPLPPTPDFGAATSLLHALHATLCLHHRRHADGRPWLGAATRAVELPLPGMPGIQLSEARGHRRVSGSPQPRLHLYAGADRAAVVAAVRADRAGGDGPARLVLVARQDELAEVRQRALAHLEGGAPAGQAVHFRERPIGGQLAFCFAGAGASYRGMGRELLLAMPQLLERLAARSTRLCEVLDWSFDETAPPPSALQQLWGASGLSQAHAEFSLGVLGLQPDAWLGYSSGETNALVASGAWRDADALMAEMESSGLVTRLLGGAFEAVAPQWGRAVDWASWTVLAPLAEVREALTGVPRVHLAIINSDSDCLIAGDAAGCAAVVARLGAHRCLKLDYPLAVHVPELDAVAASGWRCTGGRPMRPIAGGCIRPPPPAPTRQNARPARRRSWRRPTARWTCARWCARPGTTACACSSSTARATASVAPSATSSASARRWWSAWTARGPAWTVPRRRRGTARRRRAGRCRRPARRVAVRRALARAAAADALPGALAAGATAPAAAAHAPGARAAAGAGRVSRPARGDRGKTAVRSCGDRSSPRGAGRSAARNHHTALPPAASPQSARCNTPSPTSPARSKAISPRWPARSSAISRCWGRRRECS